MASVLKSAVVAGLVAGTIDIGCACTINHVGPVPILRFIASGLLGAPLPHEPWVYCLGMVLQWLMSIIIAAIFVYAATRIPALLRNWVASGIAYGVVVYFVMTFGVVPLSRARSGHVTVQSFVLNMLAMLLFGLIVAYLALRLRSPSEPRRRTAPRSNAA
ncbi:MAG TPA: hypothetical protein VHW71_18240 [Steroidobacteraceae bacterium]|jgi:hypothetical protein|nr:hypothetical protein [Steroidobacteraceae bacterium]